MSGSARENQADGSRVFHLKCILSITTGRLLSEKGTRGVYDILNFMTGDNLYTHQLPRASEECRPHLVHQLPWLEGLAPPVDADTPQMARGKPLFDWMRETVEASKERGGPFYAIFPLHPEHHEHKDPIEELRQMTNAPIAFIRTGGDPA